MNNNKHDAAECHSRHSACLSISLKLVFGWYLDCNLKLKLDLPYKNLSPAELNVRWCFEAKAVHRQLKFFRTVS